MALLDPQDVRDLLPGHALPDTQLSATMRLVAGWLRSDAGLDALPDQLDDADPLFPAALELVVLVATNPELLASKTAGPTSRAWPQAQQRDAIRAQVRELARKASTLPRGGFPPARPWPDPAERP